MITCLLVWISNVFHLNLVSVRTDPDMGSVKIIFSLKTDTRFFYKMAEATIILLFRS